MANLGEACPKWHTEPSFQVRELSPNLRAATPAHVPQWMLGPPMRMHTIKSTQLVFGAFLRMCAHLRMHARVLAHSTHMHKWFCACALHMQKPCGCADGAIARTAHRAMQNLSACADAVVMHTAHGRARERATHMHRWCSWACSTRGRSHTLVRKARTCSVFSE